MGKEKYYQYFVEGEDEKKLVDVLKSDMKLIVSGKSQVFNVTQQKLTRLRVMNLKPGTTVVLIFDADAGNLQILKDNINFLHKEKVVSEVICVIQVRNLEDELIRCCNIRQIKELLGSKSEKEYKTDLIKEKSLAKKLTEKKFDINLLWIMSDTGKYIEISDYFFDVPYEDIWNMGIHMIVSKIKFKDLEHVLTILSSETSEIPVFCTKTFLSLKKSLEDVKLVDRLWIEHDRARGKIELSYDATKEQYVGIKVLSNIRFTSEDLGLAEEIYNLYEQGSIGKVKENNQKCVM